MIITTSSAPVPALFHYMSQPLYRRLLPLSTKALEEIRLRREKPVMLYYTQKTAFLSQQGGTTTHQENAYIATAEDIQESLQKLCHGSVYAYQHEIRRGYITTDEGDRVGLSGEMVLSGEEVGNIKEIAGLNFRFSREIIGAANDFLPYVLPEDGSVNSVLLLSPPQCGKTTMLRDAARQIGELYKTVVIDERCEIAGMAKGVSHYQLGLQTDVLYNCPKSHGMSMALRTLSPRVMITDELGRAEDIAAVKEAMNCGVAVVASMHAGDAEQLDKKPYWREISPLFDRVVFLSVEEGQRRLREIEPWEK